MTSLPIRVVLPIAALLVGLFAFGCSSSDDSQADGEGAPAAAGSAGASAADAAEGYELTQTFDMGIEVTSPVFSRIRRIPKKYSCTGITRPKLGTDYELPAFAKYGARENISPPLDWTGVPEGTKSIALIMESDQAPGERWVHWLVWNLPPDTTSLAERMATTTEVASLGPTTRQGVNDDKSIGYAGPCPLPVTVSYKMTKDVKVVFEYLIHVYALDIELDLAGGATKGELLQAIDNHILSAGVIKGESVAARQLMEF